MARYLSLLLLWFVSAHALAEEAIRSFSLQSIMALGIGLYQQDKAAADAFDFLFASRPETQKLPFRGWITEYDDKVRRVFFITGADDKHPTLAYTVTVLPNHAGRIEDNHGGPLPDFVAKRYAARQAAIAAIPVFAPGRNYNFEVLNDPATEGGLLVYGLASSNSADEVVIGGHYRVSVSEDGTVKQVDALSKSFLALKKEGNNSKDLKPIGLAVTHIVSPTPVETHVYLSILHQVPLFISTSQNDLWKVEDGIISKTAPKKQAPAPAEKTLQLASPRPESPL